MEVHYRAENGRLDSRPAYSTYDCERLMQCSPYNGNYRFIISPVVPIERKDVPREKSPNGPRFSTFNKNRKLFHPTDSILKFMQYHKNLLVHNKFEVMNKTLYLTVNLIDRFLSKQSVVRKKLQLVALVSMLLAYKYEEVSVSVVGDLILISDKAYTRKEVLEMAFKEAQKVLKPSLLFGLGNLKNTQRFHLFTIWSKSQMPNSCIFVLMKPFMVWNTRTTQVLKMVSWWLICLQISIPSQWMCLSLVSYMLEPRRMWGHLESPL